MAETLEELGQILRAERERKHLSVDDVADGLKISVRILHALEAGDSTSLPHIVYVRGFVIAYGKYLGLDVQQLLTSSVLYEEGEEKPNHPAFERTVIVKKSHKASLFFLVFVCLCVGSGVWAYQNTEIFASVKNFFDAPAVHTAEPAPALPSPQEKSGVAATQKIEEKSQNEATASKNDSKDAQKKADAANKKLQAEQDAKKAQLEKEAAAKKAQEAKAAAQKAQAEKEAAAQKLARQNAARQNAVTPSAEDLPKHTGPHKVIITALTESWIQSAADDTGIRKFTLKPGDTFALTFDETLSLTLSNAGGVRIHYNGKMLPALGKKGEEKTVVFPPRL